MNTRYALSMLSPGAYPMVDFNHEGPCDEIISLVFGHGCDPAMVCDRAGRPEIGVTLADVRAELTRRLGGRALREALARCA